MFTGTYTAIVTPFREGAIDEPALRELIRRQIKGCLKSRPGGIGNIKAVSPLQSAGPGFIGLAAGLAGKHPEKLAQGLCRQQQR